MRDKSKWKKKTKMKTVICTHWISRMKQTYKWIKHLSLHYNNMEMLAINFGNLSIIIRREMVGWFEVKYKRITTKMWSEQIVYAKYGNQMFHSI